MKKFDILVREVERLQRENLILKERLGYLLPTPERNMYFVKLLDGEKLGPFCKQCSEGFSNIFVINRANVEKGWEWQCQCCKKIID